MPPGIGRRDQVLDLGVGLEREEAVGASPRHVELGECARVQVEAQPLPERRRIGSEVDDHVERGAARASHKLRLRVGRALKVHAAQRGALAIGRGAALRDARLQAMLRELVDAERAFERSTRVL
jgi:hypothetical protein